MHSFQITQVGSVTLYMPGGDPWASFLTWDDMADYLTRLYGSDLRVSDRDSGDLYVTSRHKDFGKISYWDDVGFLEFERRA